MPQASQVDPSAGIALAAQVAYTIAQPQAGLDRKSSITQLAALRTAPVVSISHALDCHRIEKDCSREEVREQRKPRFQPSSSPREEESYRMGNQEYRDANELRLRPCVREDAKQDTDRSGDGGMACSLPERKRTSELVRDPGMGESARANSTIIQSASQQQTIPTLVSSAPRPVPPNLAAICLASGKGQTHTLVSTSFQTTGTPQGMGMRPLPGIRTVAAPVEGNLSMASIAAYLIGLGLQTQKATGWVGVSASQAAMM